MDANVQIPIKKKNGIDKFVSIFKGGYDKMSPTDIDYKVFDSNGNIISYVEVIPVLKTMGVAYPLTIHIDRLNKLMSKRLNPTIVWSCDDGIIYGKVKNIAGTILFKNDDLIIFYERQKELKYVKFI